ncbi:MAG: hypothetical protein AAF705_09090, partial [Bacteroidota bacterium]
MKSGSIRLLVGVLLLALGFLAGSYWMNKNTMLKEEANQQKFVKLETDPQIDGDVNNDEGDQNSFPEATPNTNISRLNNGEIATINLFEEAAPSVCFITTSNLRQDFYS